MLYVLIVLLVLLSILSVGQAILLNRFANIIETQNDDLESLLRGRSAINTDNHLMYCENAMLRELLEKDSDRHDVVIEMLMKELEREKNSD